MNDVMLKPAIVEGALSFHASAGVDRRRLRRITGRRDDGTVGEGARISPDQDRNLRGLVAVQSLLLSGYSPAGAVRWMTTPNETLSGRTAVEMLDDEEPDAVSRVLEAAYDRMAA